MFPRRYKYGYFYKLSEILKYGFQQESITDTFPFASNKVYKRAIFNHYGIITPTSTEIPVTYLDDKRLDLISLLIQRYWDEYVFESEEEMTDSLNIMSFEDILYKARRFFGKLWNIIEFTYPKYSTILSAYDTQKDHLLDKLQRIIDTDTSNTGTSNHDIGGNGTRRDNDTPQDGGDFDDDAHTSFISSDDHTGHDNRTDNLAGTLDTTESWNDTPIIERISKIDEKYQLVMKRWLDEFAGLFIEGGNVHEV